VQKHARTLDKSTPFPFHRASNGAVCRLRLGSNCANYSISAEVNDDDIIIAIYCFDGFMTEPTVDSDAQCYSVIRSRTHGTPIKFQRTASRSNGHAKPKARQLEASASHAMDTIAKGKQFFKKIFIATGHLIKFSEFVICAP
jgi:hypothetical protein